jgi:DNA-binding transcriptional regulator YiaG
MKISKSSLAKQMGIPAQRVTYWESGKSRPRADYFLTYLKLIGFKFDTI